VAVIHNSMTPMPKSHRFLIFMFLILSLFVSLEGSIRGKNRTNGVYACAFALAGFRKPHFLPCFCGWLESSQVKL
jgi:hypothetical protein